MFMLWARGTWILGYGKCHLPLLKLGLWAKESQRARNVRKTGSYGFPSVW